MQEGRAADFRTGVEGVERRGLDHKLMSAIVQLLNRQVQS
jgi:hypothetical protein